MNRLQFVFFLILLCAGIAAGQSALYPFNVRIGGQTAELEHPSAPYAKIKDPVAASAPIQVDIKTQMVIINAFPCDEAGAPLPGKQPAIIIIQGGSTSSLSKTMNGKTLAPGRYVANVVANGKTSRIFFTVQ